MPYGRGCVKLLAAMLDARYASVKLRLRKTKVHEGMTWAANCEKDPTCFNDIIVYHIMCRWNFSTARGIFHHFTALVRGKFALPSAFKMSPFITSTLTTPFAMISYPSIMIRNIMTRHSVYWLILLQSWSRWSSHPSRLWRRLGQHSREDFILEIGVTVWDSIF